MEVRTAPPAELLDRCADLLAADPVSTNVVATVAAAEAARGRARSTYLWLERDGGPLAVAVLSPGQPVALSACDDEAAAALADALLPRGPEVVGAMGLTGSAWAFVRRWTERTGVTVTRVMSQGVYVCDAVEPPSGVPGTVRAAGEADTGLVAAWVRDFAAEAGLDPAPERVVATMLAEGRLHLWLDPDGTPVSLLGVRTSGAGMARVGPVWTPPEHRRRGYASALTADATSRVLARGHRAMLFTDLDNPTSNGIYQAVGYRRVGDAVTLRF